MPGCRRRYSADADIPWPQMGLPLALVRHYPFPGDVIVINHPSALGVALLILVAVTAAEGASSANGHRSFGVNYQTLGTILSKANAKDVMDSYQRQTNTISLERTHLDQPHLLSVSVPTGATLQGYIEIDGHTRVPLSNTSEFIDVGPYLTQSITRVTIVGSYAPALASVAIAFNGPDTVVQQQTGGTGQINYQLNLLVQ
ncbi:hypothetical protein IQ254_16595 [Nodosilinea sp. LEGE 07088]|uniref:hypothetical protein n=1 Tax=Nodosilinea sp. LEGE 07088 TaxID=2777968 RepID=UPI00187DF845|nr:hypothetical protein [Nodosilinea sp. LEGE 07088]MBE9138792.1 hypothetical protein [Nodosilinea sp. LEGE 07088]